MHTVFKGVISPETLARVNAAVDSASDGDSFELLIPPASTGALAPLTELLSRECPEIQWHPDAFVVIRTVTEKGNRAAQCWHFDNFSKTTLIVLKSTTGKDNGDIMLRTGLRGAPKSVWTYFFTKILWTNPMVWLLLRISSIRDAFFTRVPLVAGDVMLFDGSRTYHGNLPVSSGVRRSILIHEGPLFKDAPMTKFFHMLNKAYLYKTK